MSETVSSESCIIVLGMHRSGTSLFANYLQERGVAFGSDQLGAGEGNRRGHFENRRFVDFHRNALEARLSKWEAALPVAPFVFEPTPEEQEAATKLIADHATEWPWGWKDPRTCLFAPFWLNQLPDAALALVYRHPLEVCDSLLRRGTDPILATDAARAIDSWLLHNRIAFETVRSRRGVARVLAIPHAFADRQRLEMFLSNFGPMEKLSAADVWPFRPDELQTLPISPACHRLFAALFPEAAALFEMLQGAADVPALGVDDPTRDSVYSRVLAGVAGVPDNARRALLPFVLAMLGSKASPAKSVDRLMGDFDSLVRDLKHAHEIMRRKQEKIVALKGRGVP